MSDARVVLGLPAYRHVSHVDEAMEALLTQRFPRFAIVAVDDESGDGTLERLQHYAALDPRVVHVGCNDRRLGMIDNFNRTLELGRALVPGADYFAWVSDHDLWHPFWLEALVEALDSDPLAVLAYPIHFKVSESGEPLGSGGWRFETSRMANRRRRFTKVMWEMSAGNMIYGLFRLEALARTGGKRRALLPDRLLIAEVALYGRFRQVPEFLWYRRHYRGLFSVERQRRSLFGSRRPVWSWVPWWLMHPIVLARALVLRGEGRPKVSRVSGVLYAAACGSLAVAVHVNRGLRRLRKRHLPRLLGRLVAPSE